MLAGNFNHKSVINFRKFQIQGNFSTDTLTNQYKASRPQPASASRIFPHPSNFLSINGYFRVHGWFQLQKFGMSCLFIRSRLHLIHLLRSAIRFGFLWQFPARAKSQRRRDSLRICIPSICHFISLVTWTTQDCDVTWNAVNICNATYSAPTWNVAMRGILPIGEWHNSSILKLNGAHFSLTPDRKKTISSSPLTMKTVETR